MDLIIIHLAVSANAQRFNFKYGYLLNNCFEVILNKKSLPIRIRKDLSFLL